MAWFSNLQCALFFGEIAGAVGDDQSQIAGAGLVHAWKVDFVQDAMAQSEPYPAVQVERGTYAAFGAGSPARRNARPARGKAFDVPFSLTPQSSLPQLLPLRAERRILVERILPSLGR